MQNVGLLELMIVESSIFDDYGVGQSLRLQRHMSHVTPKPLQMSSSCLHPAYFVPPCPTHLRLLVEFHGTFGRF